METTKSLAELFGLTLCVIILIGYITYHYQQQSSVVVYDCSLAEISPDYPVSVKEECRKAKNDRRTNQTSK